MQSTFHNASRPRVLTATVATLLLAAAFSPLASAGSGAAPADPLGTGVAYAADLALDENPVLDPGFEFGGSPYWDARAGAVVANGVLTLPPAGSARQEFPVAGVSGVGGAAAYANVAAVSFRADGSGSVQLLMFDPATGHTFVALSAPFAGTGGRVKFDVAQSERVARSAPLALTFSGGPATVDDAALEGVGRVTRSGSHAVVLGTTTRSALLNGGLEGAATAQNGFRLSFPGAALSSQARSGEQSVDLGVANAAPRDWYALGQVAVYPLPGVVALADVESFSYHYRVPAELTRAVYFQQYLSIDSDGDGIRDVCLVHTAPAPLAQTAGWSFVSTDEGSRYFMGGEDCPGGAENELPLSAFQALPALSRARVLSVHVQTISDSLAAWPSGQSILVDDVELLVTESDRDEDGVANAFESDLSDGYVVSILPQGVVDELPGGEMHIAPSRGVFTFDLQVHHYPGGPMGTPMELLPGRGVAFTLFDREDFVRAHTEGRDLVNDPGYTYWHSADHPGSIARVDAYTYRVSVRGADIEALVDELSLRSVGAWAFYNVASDDAYPSPYGISEPAADFFSAARNAVRDLAIADTLSMAATPLFLTLPPTDVDDDGFSNDEEVSSSLTIEEALNAPFDPRATPFDRDGDGFNNTEEDRNNDGIFDPATGETDPDDATSYPRPVISVSTSPAAPHEGDIVTFTADIFYGAPLAPPGGHIVSVTWDFGDSATASGAQVTHAYDDARTYDVVVTVRENHGATNTSATTVTVVNIPPVASFTQSPGSVTQQTPVTYTSTSSDADGNIVGQTWVVDGMTVGTGTTLTRTFTSDGPHSVCLSVTDDKGATNATCATTVVLNIVPTAAFTYASTVAPSGVPQATRAVQFTSTSTDTPNDIVSFAWSANGVQFSTIANPTHVFADAGTYSVALTVVDDDGASNTRTENVRIHALPVPSFTWSPTIPTDREVVQFTDTTSHPDGIGIAAWAWNFGDGGTSTARHATHQFPDNGVYDVKLRVTDALGVVSEQVTLQVTISNIAPTAAFTIPSGELLTSAAVRFTDTSTDADGTTTVWNWNFGDAATSVARHPSHSYASYPGTFQREYSVTLSVRDNDGAWSSPASRTITVLQDTDSDGEPDLRDNDDDNDGYSDALEASHGSSPTNAASRPVDTDGDGIPDDDSPGFTGDTDDDNDSFSDSAELAAGSDPRDARSTPNDYDGDQVPNLVDSTIGQRFGNPAAHRDPCFPFEISAACIDAGSAPDSDGDGWSDQQERALSILGFHPNDPARPGFAHPSRDSNGNGIPDVVEDAVPEDSDGDGIPDAVEALIPPDSDGDGIPDAVEALIPPDSDGDGIPDAVEALLPADSDGDGIPDAVEAVVPDADNDGIPDSTEAEICARSTLRDTLATVGVLGQCRSASDYESPQALPGHGTMEEAI